MITWENGSKITTKYTIEFITNKADYEKVCDGQHPAPWELYEKREYDSLDDALSLYMCFATRNDVYDYKLFEEISVDGKPVREAYIEPHSTTFWTMRNNLNREMNQSNTKLRESISAISKELECYKAFIKKYHAEKAFKEFAESLD